MYILWLPSTLHSSPAPVTRMCDGLEPIQGPTIMYLVKQIKDTIIDILLRVQGVTKVVDIKYAIKFSDVQAQNKGLSADQPIRTVYIVLLWPTEIFKVELYGDCFDWKEKIYLLKYWI